MGLTQVSTDGVKNDAITKTKIPANQIEASELADNAVDTNAIANDAVTNAKIAAGVVNTSELTDNAVTHTKYQDIPTSRLLGRTSSGTGSPETLDASTVRTFLNVADGATASSGTTINNNADNRVITGSGSANTLNGESGLTYDGSTTVKISGSGQQQLVLGSTNAGSVALVFDGDSNGDAAGGDYSFIRHNTDGDLDFFARSTGGATNTIFKQGTTEKVRIQSGGGISFNGDTAAANALDDYEEGTWTPVITGKTHSTQAGHYTKVGRYVTCQFILQGMNSTQSSSAEISGLPFQAMNANQIGLCQMGDVTGVTYTSGYGNIYGRVNVSGSVVQLLEQKTDGTTHGPAMALQTNLTLRGYIWYMTP